MIGTLALLVTRPASAEEDGGCRRDAKREAWLERQAERWHRRLLAFEGYERPERFAICFARGGGPRVDYRRDRIFLRRVDENEDRISLAHEYLHLAFKNHPVSRDEGFIEGLARRLVLEGDRYEDNPDY
jgi:uncharacterized protein YfaQ (DUF2300 family)